MSGLVRRTQGAAGGKHEGRTIFSLLPHQARTRELLKELGAQYIPHPERRGLFSLGRDVAEREAARIDAAAGVDFDQHCRDRKLVPYGVAATLEIGDMFDFGGDVGVRKITRKSAPFIPAMASVHDPDVARHIGERMVYLHNNEPTADTAAKAARKQKSGAGKRDAEGPDAEARRHEAEEQRRQAVLLRDRCRIPVVEGELSVGDVVTIAGVERTIASLGRSWTLDKDGAAALRERFPGVARIRAGNTVQFASWDPEQEARPSAAEDATPQA